MLKRNQKNTRKKLDKIDFDLHFGVPKPPEIPPASSRNAKKWHLEQSLFRDAMEIARASAEINGSRRL